MTVRSENGRIMLEGRCRLEEAETLLEMVLADRRAPIDLSDCTAMHTAVAQVLIGVGSPVVGEPANTFLVEHLMPLVKTRTIAFADSGSPL